MWYVHIHFAKLGPWKPNRHSPPADIELFFRNIMTFASKIHEKLSSLRKTTIMFNSQNMTDTIELSRWISIQPRELFCRYIFFQNSRPKTSASHVGSHFETAINQKKSAPSAVDRWSFNFTSKLPIKRGNKSRENFTFHRSRLAPSAIWKSTLSLRST